EEDRAVLNTACEEVLVAGVLPNFLIWRACDLTLRLEGSFYLATGISSATESYAQECRTREPEAAPVSQTALQALIRWMESHHQWPALLRDIFGHYFHRAIPDRWWLTWGECTVPRLARGIYESRAFTDLPILADALEEAGCTDEAILSHCRGPGPHVRGCWVVDLLLDKE